MKRTVAKSLQLYAIPGESWQREWDQLMVSPWLLAKTDRQRRVSEHQQYVDHYCPEVRSLKHGMVVDYGCGLGELLELARAWGHDHVGVDEPLEGATMGSGFRTASALMWRRQGLHVLDVGIAKWMASEYVPYAEQCVLINSRGSLEMMFQQHLLDKTRDDNGVLKWSTWDWDSPALANDLSNFFGVAKQLLRPDGRLVMYCNGCTDDARFATVALQHAKDSGLRCHFARDRVFKWGLP